MPSFVGENQKPRAGSSPHSRHTDRAPAHTGAPGPNINSRRQSRQTRPSRIRHDKAGTVSGPLSLYHAQRWELRMLPPPVLYQVGTMIPQSSRAVNHFFRGRGRSRAPPLTISFFLASRLPLLRRAVFPAPAHPPPVEQSAPGSSQHHDHWEQMVGQPHQQVLDPLDQSRRAGGQAGGIRSPSPAVSPGVWLRLRTSARYRSTVA